MLCLEQHWVIGLAGVVLRLWSLYLSLYFKRVRRFLSYSYSWDVF